MDYFDHPYISNSNLKELRTKVDPKFKLPTNLDEIYHAGTINHQALLETYKCDKNHPKYPLAKEMADTVLRDRLCAKIILLPDFRREHEWYRIHTHGFKGVRCKTDGDSKQGSIIFEYKGLAVNTDKAFEEAIDHFDYDQAVAWYMPIVRHQNYLIAGVSKQYPDRLFKRLVNKDHQYFKRGTDKLKKSKIMWDTYIGDIGL